MSRYAVIYEETFSKDDPYDQYSTVTEKFKVFKDFEDEEGLKEWILNNNDVGHGYKRAKTVHHYIKYAELNVVQTIQIDIK